MKPLVSILIPAYNAEMWLTDTLQSALAQTWENKEIVIVDDGSKDGTLALARTFESEIVKVYTHKNSGASATRNKAYSLCHGDYIQWLDADDLLAPTRLRSRWKRWVIRPIQRYCSLASGAASCIGPRGPSLFRPGCGAICPKQNG